MGVLRAKFINVNSLTMKNLTFRPYLHIWQKIVKIINFTQKLEIYFKQLILKNKIKLQFKNQLILV